MQITRSGWIIVEHPDTREMHSRHVQEREAIESAINLAKELGKSVAIRYEQSVLVEPTADTTPDPVPDPPPDEPEPTVLTEYGLAMGEGQNRPAFPTAVGWGARSEGARHGSAGDGTDIRMLFVTNLNDGGPGSLRAALDATGRRIIVPLVGGWLDARAALAIDHGDLTYLGQFLPGGSQGIWIRNRATREDGPMGSVVFVKDDVSHVIIRYLGIPRGLHPDFAGTNEESNGNALTFNGLGATQRDIILDHVTTFGTSDNVLALKDVEGITMQNFAVLDPIAKGAHVKTFHHDFGPHLFDSERALLYAPFITRSQDRNPMLNGDEQVAWGVYAANCYIAASSRNGASSGDPKRHDIIRCFHQPGPYMGAFYWARVDVHASGDGPGPSLYLDGNVSPLIDDEDGWSGINFRNGTSQVTVKRTTPIDMPYLPPDRTTREFRDYAHRWAGLKWVIDPDTGKPQSREWGLHTKRLVEALAGAGPDDSLHANDVEAFYSEYPVKAWRIEGDSETAMIETFWSRYYEPWATKYGHSDRTKATAIDPKTGYTNIELYADDLTPTYENFPWTALEWT